jgi:hypothetical protein
LRGIGWSQDRITIRSSGGISRRSLSGDLKKHNTLNQSRQAYISSPITSRSRAKTKESYILIKSISSRNKEQEAEHQEALRGVKDHRFYQSRITWGRGISCRLSRSSES